MKIRLSCKSCSLRCKSWNMILPIRILARLIRLQLYSSCWKVWRKNVLYLQNNKRNNRKIREINKRNKIHKNAKLNKSCKNTRKRNKIMYLSRVEVSSLTCLFVYKVLNQEVLDDRGKFEVLLWKNEFWKVEDKISEDHVYLARIVKKSEGFLGCLWQRIWSAIRFRLRSLKPRRELQALSNASPKNRIESDRPTLDRDESFGWGWKTAERVYENIQEGSKYTFREIHIYIYI